MKLATIPFRPEDFLSDGKSLAEYVSLALRENDPEYLLHALNTAARVHGMTSIAQIPGITHEAFHESFQDGAKSYFDMIGRVVDALGMQLAAVPLDGRKRRGR